MDNHENKAVKGPNKLRQLWGAWPIILLVAIVLFAGLIGFVSNRSSSATDQSSSEAVETHQQELERYDAAIAAAKAAEEQNALLNAQEPANEDYDDSSDNYGDNYDDDYCDGCFGDFDDSENSDIYDDDYDTALYYGEEDEDLVYITNTGERYHRATCSSLSHSSYEVTLSEATDAGYTPCKNCHPPTE